MFLELTGPVVADTVYKDGKLVAKDTTVTLPSVTPKTIEQSAMGTVVSAILSQLEAMETTINKVGVDQGFRSLCGPESAVYEFRWIQDVRTASGGTKSVGCKAFIRGSTLGIPGISLEVGSNIEGEFKLGTTRYQLIVDGEEYLLVDQLNGIMRIAGKDYMENITNLL